MEFPRTALNIQRGIALLMLALVLGVAVIERASPFASRLRADRSWLFWLAVREFDRADVPAFHLGIYNPLRRSLVLIRIPDTIKLQGKLTAARVYIDALRATKDEESASRAVEDLAQIKISALSLEPISWEGAGRLALERPGGAETEDEPAAAAALALKSRGGSPRDLFAMARHALAGALHGDRAPTDALLLTLELRRTALEGLRPALLPDDASSPGFLARAFATLPAPALETGEIVVEVLNGTSVQGLAAQAAKVLRSKGVDVMALGRAPRPRSRTIVYDRTGDFDRAARVRAALGCPTAIAATRIDAQRGVDVSVELGDNCTF